MVHWLNNLTTLGGIVAGENHVYSDHYEDQNE